jgi:hypothetical protein
MQVIEAQCPRSWRLTITLHIKHERAFGWGHARGRGGLYLAGLRKPGPRLQFL